MFSFITECLELYYTRKLLSAAHSRIDRYVSLKFQGIKCATVSQESITKLDSNSYLINSQTEVGVKYLVDMEIGVCSCNAGRDGSPCSHQTAVVRHYKIFSINCIPVTSEARQLLAKVAVGNSSLPPEFYSSLHEKKVIPQEKKQKDSLQGPFWT